MSDSLDLTPHSNETTDRIDILNTIIRIKRICREAPKSSSQEFTDWVTRHHPDDLRLALAYVNGGDLKHILSTGEWPEHD